MGRASRVSVLHILGIALGGLGDQERAIAVLRESLRTCREMGVKPGMVSGLEGVAGIYSGIGQAEQAVRLYGAAAKMREEIGIPLPASERLSHESHLTVTRAECGEDVWQAAWDQGQAMSLEQAIAYALEENA